ncbi:MAG TPA: hypothetical protein VMF09_07810 [Solirubrobacteraceae bacterium]|nr:hypothetical protein [Solirubrobacteraceae bacterium]
MGIHRQSGIVTIVLALTVICTAPAVAAGSSLVRLHAEAEGAPAWSGTNVLVLVRAGQGFQVRAVDPASGAESAVASIPRRLGASQLAASPALIGIEQADPRCDEPGCKYENWQLEGEELLAGPPGATLQCLVGFGSGSCAGLASCYGAADLLVSASRIAYRECGDSSAGQTVVVDYSTAPPTRSIVPQLALPEAISGPWLVGLSPAWQEQHQPSGTAGPATAPALIERNLETGAEPLHIELPETGGDEFAAETNYPALASVQEDGRIAYVSPKETAYGPEPESLYTASPAEPRPRAILSARVSSRYRQFIPDQRLFLAGDLLGLEERLPNRHDRPDPLQRLELANLEGQRLGGFGLGENTVVPFDFNGSELVAVKTPCAESFMITWGPGQPQPPVPPSGVCPTPRLARITLGRHGLTATITCPASPPLGCVEPTIRIKLHVRGKAVSSRGETNDMFPGRKATLTAPLGAGSLRWLRQHRNPWVGVEIESLNSETSTTHIRVR